MRAEAGTSLALREVMLALGLGVALGFVGIMATSASPKWGMAVLVAVTGGSVLLAFRQRVQLLQYMLVALLPIGLDFNLILFQGLPYRAPITGVRITAFDIVFAVLLLHWLYRLLVVRMDRVRLYPVVTIPFFAIWSIAILSMGGSPLPGVLKSAYLAYSLRNWLVFIYAANNLRTARDYWIVVGVFLGMGALESLLALAQFATGSSLGLEILGATSEKTFFSMMAGASVIGRAAGTFGHPNQFALYLNPLFCWALALFFAPVGLLKRSYLTATGGLIALGIVVAMSRGGWLAAAVGGIFTLYASLSRRMRDRILPAVLIIVIGVSAMASAVGLIEPVRKRIFESDHGTAYTRVPLAYTALNMITEHPLTGVGLGSYTAVVQRYDNTRERISWLFPAPVHNEFLLVAAELGLPALALVLWLMAVFAVQAIRIHRPGGKPLWTYFSFGVLGGGVAWVVHLQFDYLYHILAVPSYWFIAGMIFAGVRLAEQEVAEQGPQGN